MTAAMPVARSPIKYDRWATPSVNTVSITIVEFAIAFLPFGVPAATPLLVNETRIELTRLLLPRRRLVRACDRPLPPNHVHIFWLGNSRDVVDANMTPHQPACPTLLGHAHANCLHFSLSQSAHHLPATSGNPRPRHYSVAHLAYRLKRIRWGQRLGIAGIVLTRASGDSFRCSEPHLPRRLTH